MDQVNGFLKVMKRHYFWVLTGLVVLSGLGTWFYATGQLRAEYETHKATIETTKGQINLIKNEPTHPNDSSKQAMQDRINAFAQEVEAVWRTLYNHQKENTLVWPTKLQNDFISKVNQLRPIEAKIDFPTPPNQELSSNFTERYRDYIKAELPKLAETIGAKWEPSASGGGGSLRLGEASRFSLGGNERTGVAGVTPEKEPLVNWNPANQAQIQQERFDWPTAPPTTLQVLYAQEDLWVLQTIMDIVANTNGDATAHHRATVKEIESIALGRNAVGLVGKVQRLKSRVTGGDDYFGGGGEMIPTESATPMPIPLEQGRGDGTAGVAMDPADYRYVDANNMPIPATDLRTALRENSPETAFLSVAKRLPIRLRVIMDQRKIPVLLAECGSAPLTIEVRQVRVNREAGASSGTGREYGGAAESGRSYTRPGTGQTDASTSYDVPVEIYGVVYIFNPPNDDILKLSDKQIAEATAAANPTPIAPAPIGAAPAVPAEPAPAEPVAPAPAPAEPVAPAPAEPAPAAPAADPNGGPPAAAP